MQQYLQIKKRNDELVPFDFKKIHNRIKKASKGLKSVNSDTIMLKVLTSMPTSGIVTTKSLDNLIADTAASYITTHYEYSKLGSAVLISSFYKETDEVFSSVMRNLNDASKNKGKKVISDELIKIIEKYGEDKVNAIIDYSRDSIFDFFAWKALETTYLLKNGFGKVVERPQQMYLRVALWLTDSFEEAVEYYTFLSKQLISPATPIMINAGCINAQLSSCVLHFNDGDSRDGLLNTFKDICVYSSHAAGIGVSLSNQRSKESKIASSGGNAGGILKYAKILNEGLRFFDQNGKRLGAAAIYLEPWHKDIFDLLDIKRNQGKDELRARDIFTALWIPDNFMKAVETDSDYYLFCPNEIKLAGLKPFYEIYGEEFEAEYQKAIDLGLGTKVKAKDIWLKIYESQVEKGVPYMLYKDHVNRKSNHQNIGTIKQSNLCAEIVEYTDEETTATCNLSSQVLKNFVRNGKFDYKLLSESTKKTVRALNKVIDINNYSTIKGEKGGKEQRAIAIGIQGFADTLYLLDYDFSSEQAKELNKKIFETIYYTALRESCDLVKNGRYEKYKFFDGSPLSQGKFQFDLWGVNASELSGMYDWEELRKDIIKYGVCNSLVTALMPTAGSAKITNSYEKDELIDSNLFNRKVLGGEFVIANQYLVDDLEEISLWNENIKDEIIIGSGSIQNVNFAKYISSKDPEYDAKIKRVEFLLKKYKTQWEISQKEFINMVADRSIFIDQTQSMNIYMSEPTLGKVTSSHFYAWKKGLKTGCYYLRTKAISTGAKHLGIDMAKSETPEEKEARELKEFQDRITEELSKNIEKPSNSNFECFGCGS